MDAREALNAVRDMRERGLEGIEVTDENGKSYDLVELERLTGERDRPNT